jgi:uncharacterized protein YbjT (DUF2867 family)
MENAYGKLQTGGSVVNSLLADSTFAPRAVTRDPGSEDALKLKSRGAEVVQADLTSEDTTALDNALSGSEGVFGVCTFALRELVVESDAFFTKLLWIPELEPMVRLVEAAKRANVRLFVFR